MTKFRVFFLIISFMLSQATFISRYFVAKSECDDKKSNYELLREYNSSSLIECATLCQRDCVFFGYNPILMKCRTHKEIFTSQMSDEIGWSYYSHFILTDCKDLLEDGRNNTGLYEIYSYGTSSRSVRVYCDMETMDGGWTVIQKRVDGSLSFERTWLEYKNGFGESEQNVWIGNDAIHHLTKGKNSSLYVSITLVNGSKLNELYAHFSVSDEAALYKLLLAGPATGTLGDRMMDTGSSNTDPSGMNFTSPDRDNDRMSGNCARSYKGGWWFNNCHDAFLNGQWSPGYWYETWTPTIQNGTSVRETMMMIRRH
ncbi:fibroleukin-like [Saccostrea echinata]|uniref:fibroleukin-like n=1 Tax=Saccostrea echinata TaxID=191078 RepID=UPI002A80FFED|nr:fibroleukin-like [Saccostrea echinata]